MKIKSLLIGSAALMTASTAYAADPIVMAEPEPVEYVRVCDVYGPGFFYIPGTETCLKIGGYARFQVNLPNYGGYDTFTRFQLNVDARSDTEWGTLRGYAEGRFDYGMTTAGFAVSQTTGLIVATVPGMATATYLNQGFIELSTGAGTLRLGKSDAPYARFLGYGAPFGPFDGTYGFSNGNELSFQFGGANGFSGIVALLDDGSPVGWTTDVEAGLRFSQGWGSVGAIAGYDGSTNTWGAKGVVRFTAPNSGFGAGLHVFYASGPGRYQITDPGNAAVAMGAVPAAAAGAHWSVLGHVSAAFSPKVGAALSGQWFSYTGGWVVTAGLDLKPVAGLQIQPEIQYRSTNASWAGVVRVNRSF